MPRPNRAVACRWITTLLAVLSFATPARVLTFPGENTLEWIVADSDVIVRGVVEDLSLKPPVGKNLVHVTFRVSEMIKNSSAATTRPLIDSGVQIITFSADLNSQSQGFKVGRECVIFLVDTERYLKPRSDYAGEAAAVFRANRLSARTDSEHNPIYLPNNRKPVIAVELISSNGYRIDLANLLSAIRAEAALPQKNEPLSFDMTVAQTSEVFPISKWNFPSRLRILIDDRAAQLARQWLKSKDDTDRWNGVVILNHVKSQENIAPLRAMLDDLFLAPTAEWNPEGSGATFLNGPGKWNMKAYPVRKVAYHGLKPLGAAPDEVVLEEPIYPHAYWPRSLARGVLAGLCAILLAVIFLPHVRRKRGPPAATLRRRSILTGFTGVSLLLLIACSALLARSYWSAMELSFTSGNSVRYEISAIAGRFRMMRFAGDDMVTPVTFMSARRDSGGNVDGDWQIPATPKIALPGMPPPSHVGGFGFHIDRDDILGVNFEFTHYIAWTLPLWSLCGLFAILPAVRVTRVIRARRLGPGFCAACGYDLRATPDRCPECGASKESREVQACGEV